MQELLQALTKVHREVFLPDFERIVGNEVEGAEGRLRAELRAGFVALAHRLDRLIALTDEQVTLLEVDPCK